MMEPQRDVTRESGWSRGDNYTRRSRWHYFPKGASVSLCNRVYHKELPTPRRVEVQDKCAACIRIYTRLPQHAR